MRIMIDVDGVIANFSKTFTKLAYDMGLTKNIVNDYDQEHWDYDFADTPVWEKWKRLYNPWMTIEPLVSNDEILLLNNIIKTHDVYFITTRPRTRGLSAEMQTRYWLNSIGIYTDKTSVISTKAGTKGALCSALDIEVAIDDKSSNVIDIREHNIFCAVRDMKHNKSIDDPRYDTLGDFLDDLKDIEKGL